MSNNPFDMAERAFESVEFDGKKLPKEFVEKLRGQLSAEIRAELEPAIKREATDSALRGLKDHWKKEMSKRLGLQEIESAETFKDAVDFIAGKLSSEPRATQPDQPPASSTVDAEKIKAQIRSELEKEFFAERKQLRQKSVLEQLTATAIAKGLDSRYRELVPDMISKKFNIEIGDDSSVVYRDKSGNIILEGANDPTPDFLIGKIAEDYKEIFVTPRPGTGAANPSGGKGSPEQKTYRDTTDMIAASISIN